MGRSRMFSSLALMIILCSNQVHGQALLSACSTDADCGAGLYCDNCTAAGATALRCIRDKATSLTNITSLPFNKVSWLVTHNSYAITGFPDETGLRITFTNQEDNVTYQLNNGVRGLMLDTYDFDNDVWLCHSFGGVCYNETAFEPLLNTLNDVQTFLAANPSEIVTIILEDYVTAPNGLTNVFTAANLKQYWFPVASMPANGGNWPTVGTMIKNNWRLLVFTSKSSKQATEGIAYQWNFMNENQYGDEGMQVGNCSNRAESKPLNNTSVSLILQNFFRTDPVEGDSCSDNSEILYNQLPACYAASGNRWANFLAVDFYKRSTGGGSFQALDKLNGRLECGCNSPLSCKNQTSSGQCSADPNPPAQTSSGQCPDDPSLAEFLPTFVPSPRGAPAPHVSNGTGNGGTIYGSGVSPPPTGQNSAPSPGPSSGTSARTSFALLVVLVLISCSSLNYF